MTDNKAVVEAFWKSVNERNWSSFLEYLTPDCEYVYASIKGKEAVLQRFKQGGGVDMGFQQRVERITAEGDVVVVETIWSGTHTGDILGIPPSGRRFEVPMVFIMEFRDGLIKSIKSIFNEAELRRILTS